MALFHKPFNFQFLKIPWMYWVVKKIIIAPTICKIIATHFQLIRKEDCPPYIISTLICLKCSCLHNCEMFSAFMTMCSWSVMLNLFHLIGGSKPPMHLSRWPGTFYVCGGGEIRNYSQAHYSCLPKRITNLAPLPTSRGAIICHSYQPFCCQISKASVTK